jgi:hypothetical protein
LNVMRSRRENFQENVVRNVFEGAADCKGSTQIRRAHVELARPSELVAGSAEVSESGQMLGLPQYHKDAVTAGANRLTIWRRARMSNFVFIHVRQPDSDGRTF